jgi:four helix bundle protein
MIYKRFEDLPVWQEAMRLAHGVYDLTENPSFRISPSLRDQIERSSMSVSDSIAEGFESGNKNELLIFLFIARGSAGETRSKLCFMDNRRSLVHFQPDFARLKTLAESCSQQLRTWSDQLQNSELTGWRHPTTQLHRDQDQWSRAGEMRKTFLRRLPPNHPLRQEAEERGAI